MTPLLCVFLLSSSQKQRRFPVLTASLFCSVCFVLNPVTGHPIRVALTEIGPDVVKTLILPPGEPKHWRNLE